MTRVASAFLFLLMMASAPLSAAQTKLVDDVIRMSRAGVSDDAIVVFVQAIRDRPPVTADEVIAMKAARVSDAVIRAMIAQQPPGPAQAGGEPPTRNPGGDGAVPDVPPQSQSPEAAGGGCVVFEPPIPPFYAPPYPSWIWNPNWYQPTLDANGGANPMERHAGTPPPVLDRAPSPIERGDQIVGGEKDKSTRDVSRRERSTSDSQDRDSGSRSGGRSRGDSSRHR